MSIWARMLKQSSLYAIATIASRFISILLLPIYTRTLTPADYGVLELISTSFMMVELLMGARSADALIYYYSKAKDAVDPERARISVIQTSLAGSFVWGGVALLGGWLASEPLSLLVLKSTEYTPLFRLGFLGICLGVIGDVVVTYFRLMDRPIAYAAVSLTRLAVNVTACLWLLLAAKLGTLGVMWANSLGVAAVAGTSLVYLIRKFGWGFDYRLFLRQVAYAYPIALSAVGMIMVHYGDRYFLMRNATLGEVGIYSLAYKIGMMVSVVHTPFSTYWSAQMFQIVQSEGTNWLYARLFTYLTFVLTACAMLLTLFVHPILTVLAPSSYSGVAAFVPWLLLAYVLRAMGDHLRGIFNIHRRTHEHAIVMWSGATVSVLLYAVLIPRFKVGGAVAATLLAFLIMLVLTYIRAQRIQRFRFEWGRITKLMLASVVVGGGQMLWPVSGFWLQVATGCGSLAVWMVALWVSGAIEQQDKQKLRALLSREKETA